ncbi:MAG: hypothetical protein D6742_05940 [Cyanobacteria bacterium J069]|nr:MAG: hypothetical protein D6742_05940 [Cyanobacteria bacterium J069]
MNSDHAIQILMAYDLRLPQDLYYWGQDRLGSLIAILAHGLIQITPLSPVVAVSVVQYLFLIAGFIAFSSLFQSSLLKIILGVVWLLPLSPFGELIQSAHPYAPQLALIGIAVALANQLMQIEHLRKEPVSGWRRIWTLSAISTCLMLSIWISDLSILICFLFIITVLFHRYQFDIFSLSVWRKPRPNRADMLAVAVPFVAGLLFIIFAKSQAMRRVEGYSSLNSPDEFFQVVSTLFNAAVETLTFRHGILLGLHLILAIALFTAIAFTVYRSLVNSQLPARLYPSPWFYFAIGSAGLSMAALLSLNWVHHNSVKLRYFTAVYFFCWLSILLLVQSFQGKTFRRISALLLCTALVSSFTTPQAFALARSPSTIAQLQPFRALAPAGFIGDYWSSYLLCSVDPANLNCTPHERNWKTPCNPQEVSQTPSEPPFSSSRLRCLRCTKNALSAPNIYVVKG